jgi:hypothetical protein
LEETAGRDWLNQSIATKMHKGCNSIYQIDSDTSKKTYTYTERDITYIHKSQYKCKDYYRWDNSIQIPSSPSNPSARSAVPRFRGGTGGASA